MAETEMKIKPDRWTFGHAAVGVLMGVTGVPWYAALAVPLIPLLIDRERKKQPPGQLALDWIALGVGYGGGRVIRAVVVEPSSSTYLVVEGDSGDEYLVPAMALPPGGEA